MTFKWWIWTPFGLLEYRWVYSTATIIDYRDHRKARKKWAQRSD